MMKLKRWVLAIAPLLAACAAPTVHHGPMPETPLRAVGNEPGWHVEIGEGQLRVVTDYGARQADHPLPAPQRIAGGWRYRIDGGPSVTLHERLCHDNMTGMPYPMVARLDEGERTLHGCAGDPHILLQGEWEVTELDGAALLDDSRITLHFDGERVSGLATCNRYFAAYHLSGEGLTLQPAASTLMMCIDAAQMAQERRFLDQLGEIRHFDIDAQGALRLITPDSDIRAQRP